MLHLGPIQDGSGANAQEPLDAPEIGELSLERGNDRYSYPPALLPGGTVDSKVLLYDYP
jgi:hypothetical protein